MKRVLEIAAEVKQKLKWRWRLLFVTETETVKPEDISIVVVGRNDNYGGDFSLRLKTTFDWNLSKLPGAELIYVEWNRIEGKASDCEWITSRYEAARCYSVSNTVHTSITENPKMPVMEYFAKNLGMRKASRKWLLMINADCLLGDQTIQHMKQLSRKHVYGTNYVSFKWDGQPITNQHLNRKLHVVRFAAPDNIGAVVGNLILTHRDNWLKATGYDERLKNVRAGVDSNGLNQLLHLGLKQAVIGTHYHLDHPESIVHGTNATHGLHKFDNIPYQNPDNWGFNDKQFVQTSERLWQLNEI